MKAWQSYLLVALVALATFLPILRNDFVNWDDPATIRDNPRFRPPTVGGILHYWKHADAGLYVPVTYSVWAGIAALAFDGQQMAAWWFHAASAIVHAISSAIALRILRQLVFQDRYAMLGALVFAVHPVQVESVAWASGLKDLLAGMMSLALITTYLHDGKRRAWRTALLVATLLLGMLAKPVAIVAPVLAGVLDVVARGRAVTRTIRRLWPLALLAAPCVVWSRAVQPAWEQIATALWTRPFIAGDALAFYFGKLLWPAVLTPLYGRSPAAVVESGMLFVAWIVPVAILLVVAAMRKRAPVVLAGALVFIVALAPVLGFASFSFQLYSTVADHYLYLPMLGIGLVVAGLLARIGRDWAGAVALILVVMLAGRSIVQQRVWRDGVTLFGHAVEQRPLDPQAHASLAIALAESGQVELAIPHYEFVARARPNNANIHLVLARALAAAGRTREALRELEIAAVLSGQEPSIVAERDALRAKLDSPTTRD